MYDQLVNQIDLYPINQSNYLTSGRFVEGADDWHEQARGLPTVRHFEKDARQLFWKYLHKKTLLEWLLINMEFILLVCVNKNWEIFNSSAMNIRFSLQAKRPS